MTKGIARDLADAPIQAIRPVLTQTVSVSGTSAAIADAFRGNSTLVRIVSTTDCHYTLATAPTATGSHAFLPANVVEYILVRPGEKIAFIQNAANGTAYVTETK